MKSHNQNRKKLSYEGIPVRLVNDSKSCISAINKLLSYQRNNQPLFVGFDMEWKTTLQHQHYNCQFTESTNPTALIQIGHQKLIILIQIHLFKHNIPNKLISFLSNDQIIKCGVGIFDDANKLWNDYNMIMYGMVELNDINLLREESSRIWGLAKTSRKILKKNMKYKNSINHLQWANRNLNSKYIRYACDDAITAYDIFKTIVQTQYHEDEHIMDICFAQYNQQDNYGYQYQDNYPQQRKGTKSRNKNSKSHKNRSRNRQRRKVKTNKKHVQTRSNNKKHVISSKKSTSFWWKVDK
eukprot:216986_1